MPHKDQATNAAYLRDWKRRNRARLAPRQKAIDAARHANARAAKHGAPGRLTIDEAAEILAVGRCHYCDATEALTLDHVRALVDGGLNRPENIVCACHPCNTSKHTADRPGRWARRHEECVDCGTTDRRHICHGRCSRCYMRVRAS